MNRHHLSIFLMTTSLVLLAVFLFLFLKNSYQDEVEALQKETGYLFVNSVRGVEGQMFEKILFRQFSSVTDSAHRHVTNINEHTWVGEKGRNISIDTSILIAILDEEAAHFSKDTSFELTIRSSEKTKSLGDLKGSLSVMIALDGDTTHSDSVLVKNKVRSIIGRLEKDFTENMELANLPVKYKVVKIDNDSSGLIDLMGTGTYTDVASGEKYGVELSGFNQYVLKKITPQILFSLGLFSIVSLAFFTVFKNLQKQQRLTELKNDLIQNITHELKTPIATVGVAIEALQEFEAIKNPARTQEYLDISKNELNRLSLLVDKVLRMSLFEKKEPELKLEKVDLKVLIGNILNSMKIQFEKKNATVVPGYSGGSFSLMGDPTHLSSVIYNLLDNALKYTKDSPAIQVDLKEESNQLFLKIIDNGVGIPSDYQGKIFDRFFRVPSGDLHNVKGHGLGLSYVASVVEKHGGIIKVESEEGKGSVFEIVLPQNA